MIIRELMLSDNEDDLIIAYRALDQRNEAEIVDFYWVMNARHWLSRNHQEMNILDHIFTLAGKSKRNRKLDGIICTTIFKYEE